MRIATWNVERGGRKKGAAVLQRQVLDELAADVVAVTEPPSSFVQGPGVVTSPPRRAGACGNESWVAILGAGVEQIPLAIPYERLAVAARVMVRSEPLVLYCSVLPWLAITNHAPYLVRPGESALGVFERVLGEQVEDVKRLRREHGEPVIWAGDFNQTLEGKTQGGSAARRVLLQSALDALGYSAWNASAAHATTGLRAVDLICGSRERVVVAQGRIDPERDGVVMSDHAGYWVEI